jgi:C4-dicarboxylate-binding protein DctP
MAFSEVYQALQTGVVDGADGNLSNLYTQKLYEVQKHVTLTNHTYSGYVVVVNKAFWTKLPADVRTELEAAMKDATDYNTRIAVEDDAKSLAAIKASGKTQVHAPTADEKKAWMKAMLPVQDEMAPRIGKELIEAIRKETGVTVN